MTAPAIDSQIEIVGGVDTHHDTHTAAALDAAGELLGCRQFPATAAGYTALLAWLTSLGCLVRVGIEGTSSYGAGLAVVLRAVGVCVVEVDRPDRATRRRSGKSVPIDAAAAARAVLAGRATGAGKSHDGVVECIRVLRIARPLCADTQVQVDSKETPHSIHQRSTASTRSSVTWIPNTTPTPPPRSMLPGSCWAAGSSRPPPPATPRCWPG